MLEPSSGRTTTSGPGAPLLLGFAATAALVVVFLIGFQLGSGQQRVQTVIVGGSPSAAPSGDIEATSSVPARGRIQAPTVDDELQQAYYANVRLGTWVVCSDGASLHCEPMKGQLVDASRGFQPPEFYWNDLPRSALDVATRVYLAGNVDEIFVGAIDVSPPHGWHRLLGVTLNGSVQFLDLGVLPPGRYVIMDQSFSRQGQVTLGAGLTVGPRP